MTICKYFNGPTGCKYGDRCRYEHVESEYEEEENSSSDDDGPPLEFWARFEQLDVKCNTCSADCEYKMPRCSNNAHRIDWYTISCGDCGFDLDPDEIKYPSDWSTPKFLWLLQCPSCNTSFGSARGNSRGIELD